MAAERTIRIKFDGTARGLSSATAKARAELKALEKQVETNKSNLSSFAGGVGNVAKELALFTAKVAAIATVINFLPALVAGIVALSGALPLAVAGGFALAGVMATMKLGADGVKAAFAQLTPTLDTLKANVSSSFEKSLTPAVNNLKAILPQLTSGFQQVATAIGGVATRTTSLLKTPAAVAQLNAILSGTARLMQNLGAFIAPVIAAFVRIGAVAMPMLVQLTAGAGAVGDKFNAWIQQMADTGAIQRFIQGGIDAFKSIWGVIKDVGSIVGEVMTALSDAGLGLGGVIGPVIGQIKDFVQSAQGHDTIVALADGIKAIGDAVGQVLKAALDAIGPALPDLVSAFKDLVTAITPAFVEVVKGLGVALQGVAQFAAENTSWLVPLVVAIGGIALAIRGVALAVKAWELAVAAYTVVQWLLNTALFANPIGIIILAIIALIAIIVLVIMNLDFFKGVWDAVWKWCSDIITTVVNWFRNQWQSVWDWLTGLWNGITGFFSGIWRGVTDGVGRAVQWVKDLWSGAVEGVKGFFRGLGSFVGGIWDGITSGLRSAVNGLIRFANMAIDGVNTVTGVVGIPAIPHIPQLARGGTAQGGRSYLVGERGPELFTPGQTGRVTSNDQTFNGGPQVIELHLDLGEGIKQVVEVHIDQSNRAIRRSATVMAGGTVR